MSTIPLGTDALTAFRIVMDNDGKADLAQVLAAWSLLDHTHPVRHTIGDLPEEFIRQEGQVRLDRPVDPIRLTLDELLIEAFRLTALRDGLNPKEWIGHSNVSRSGAILAKKLDLKALGASSEKFSNLLLKSRHVINRTDGSSVFIKLKIFEGDLILGEIPMVAVTARCPGEVKERFFGEFQSFGQARQHLLRCPTGLVASGTKITMQRGEETLSATYDHERYRWLTPDGQSLKRLDVRDPVSHPYKNGRLVGGFIGYIVISHKGRITANVGIAIDSDGDHDAMLSNEGRRDFDSIEDALTALRERDDLDHIFENPIKGSAMGAWLSAFDPEKKDPA